MTKTQLIDSVVEETGFSKVDTNKIINTLLDQISKELKKGHRLTIRGFGTFGTTSREAYKGHNPSNGQVIDIPKQSRVTFKASKKLKEAVNNI
jgi:DNA-binding protein HU-beta